MVLSAAVDGIVFYHCCPEPVSLSPVSLRCKQPGDKRSRLIIFVCLSGCGWKWLLRLKGVRWDPNDFHVPLI